MLKEQAGLGKALIYSGNEKVKVRNNGGKRIVCLTVMTGKGIHSKGRKSILKPAVADWCD